MDNHISDSWGEKRYIPIASKPKLLRAVHFHLPLPKSQKERPIPNRGVFMPVS